MTAPDRNVPSAGTVSRGGTFQEFGDSPLGIVKRTQRILPGDESNVTAAGGKLDGDQVIGLGDRTNFVEHLARQEGIVDRAQEQRRYSNTGEKPNRTRTLVIIGGIGEAMNGRRHGIIEVVNGSGAVKTLPRHQIGVLFELRERFPSERPQKVVLIHARETAVNVARRAREIEWHGDAPPPQRRVPALIPQALPAT